MDYIFGHKEEERSLKDDIVSYFKNRRRQLQDWEAEPPYKVGWLVLGLVSFEIVITDRLTAGQGLGLEVIREIFGWALSFFALGWVVLKITQSVAEYYGKKGFAKPTWAFLYIGLYPLLLYLPIGFAVWISGSSEAWQLLSFLILLIYVGSNWKESIEITYELSRFQSLFVIYATFILLILLYSLISYVRVIQIVAELSQSLP